MLPFPLNDGNAVIDEDGLDLSVVTLHGNPAVVDLLPLAPYQFERLLITARTSNPQGDPAPVLHVNHAFTNAPIATLADAPSELHQRRGWMECFISPATWGPAAGTRQHKSQPIAIEGRYLYLWWSANAGGAGREIDLEVWVTAVK